MTFQDRARLLFHLDGQGILRLTLNDPDRRNALSEATLTRLGLAFADAGTNPTVRVVVPLADGPAFCAGHDLRELTAGRAAPVKERTCFARIMALCSGVVQAIVTCPKPVIAEISGIATTELARRVAAKSGRTSAIGKRAFYPSARGVWPRLMTMPRRSRLKTCRPPTPRKGKAPWSQSAHPKGWIASTGLHPVSRR